MIWTIPELSLNSVTPNEAAASRDTPLELALEGQNFAAGMQLVFIRSPSPIRDGIITPAQVLPGHALEITDGNFRARCRILLEDAETGTYDAILWNPPLDDDTKNEVSVLRDALTVVAGDRDPRTS